MPTKKKAPKKPNTKTQGKPILMHLFLATITFCLITWGTLKIISNYTHHDNIILVPDFKKVCVDSVDEFIFQQQANLQYQIIDSIYTSEFPKGAVIEQDPVPGSKVKPNRTIYLTVTAKGKEKVAMPNLIDLSLKQATTILETYGLVLDKLEYVPDIAENAVIKQKYKDEEIEAGDPIEKGSAIVLVLGEGLSSEKIDLPDLVGKTETQAKELLEFLSLNIGSVIYTEDIDTTMEKYVYKQYPVVIENAKISLGSTIDIWISNDSITQADLKAE